jgi:cytochrome P450
MDCASGWAQALPFASMLLRQCPTFLTPILGPVISLPCYWYHRAYVKILQPEIIRRQRVFDGTTKEQKPNDFLQWQIDRGAASGIPMESEPKVIDARMLAMNFAAIHTSTFGLTQTLFDLLASSEANISALREETTAALATTDGEWTKSVVQQLIKHDSALRESMRQSSILSMGLVRQVMNPDGLTAPNGTHLPCGSWISVPTNAIHNDPDLYEEPQIYRPFRFSAQREAAAQTEIEKVPETEDPKKAARDAMLKKANLSIVSVGPAFHPFGYGRSACPGRFFAANELKMILAHALTHYDIQMLETRPPSMWIANAQIPPAKATITIRRRGGVTKS